MVIHERSTPVKGALRAALIASAALMAGGVFLWAVWPRNIHATSVDITVSEAHGYQAVVEVNGSDRDMLILMRYELDASTWQAHSPALLDDTTCDDVTDLAQAFPGATIVMDHVGGPLGIGPYQGRRDAVFADWKTAIDRLAACPNVVVKLGGLAMKINGFDWHKRARPPGSEELAAAVAPYLLHCIERFGAARAMFESNFPVDKASCSYVVLWNAFKRVTESFSATDRAALFHDTAARVYRL